MVVRSGGLMSWDSRSGSGWIGDFDRLWSKSWSRAGQQGQLDYWSRLSYHSHEIHFVIKYKHCIDLWDSSVSSKKKNSLLVRAQGEFEGADQLKLQEGQKKSVGERLVFFSRQGLPVLRSHEVRAYLSKLVIWIDATGSSNTMYQGSLWDLHPVQFLLSKLKSKGFPSVHSRIFLCYGTRAQLSNRQFLRFLL